MRPRPRNRQATASRPCPSGCAIFAIVTSMPSASRLSVSSSLSLCGAMPDSRDRAHHLVHELGVAELPHAHVDGDAEVRAIGPLAHAASCAQACSSTQRPIGTISEVSSAVGDEMRRRHHVALRMLPAQQRLHAGHAPVGAHLRLVVDAGTGPSRQAWRRSVASAALAVRHRLHLGVEEADGVAARALGLVHRQVGLLEQLAHASTASCRTASRRCCRCCGAGSPAAHRARPASARMRSLTTRRAGRGSSGLCPVFSSRITNSSPPRRATVSPRGDAGAQALGDLLQQLVALLVAQRVVEHLEVVQVDEHQRAFARPVVARTARHAAGPAGAAGWAAS